MTLPRLSLHAEAYARTGGLGDGVRKLLGQPTISLAETVLREALQNACDAAANATEAARGGRGPEVLIRLRDLAAEEAAAVRRHVLRDLPDNPASRDPLLRWLDSDEPRVLEICDFNASGLRGPTRADRIPTGATALNFINFLRNVGAERNTHQGGGTYGFGKVALYLASACRTILVDTLTDEGGPDARRFMGCHLGAGFERPEGEGLAQALHRTLLVGQAERRERRQLRRAGGGGRGGRDRRVAWSPVAGGRAYGNVDHDSRPGGRHIGRRSYRRSHFRGAALAFLAADEALAVG